MFFFLSYKNDLMNSVNRSSSTIYISIIKTAVKNLNDFQVEIQILPIERNDFAELWPHNKTPKVLIHKL